MRKLIYKRKKKEEKKPTEAVNKTGSRGTRGGKPKSTISETLQKLKSDKVVSKNNRGKGANKRANELASEKKELQATMKKTSRGLRPTKATRKLLLERKEKKNKVSSKKKTNRVATSKAPIKKKISSSEAVKTNVGKKKATEAVAEVVKKQQEKKTSPTEKVYTDKEGKKYKKVRTASSKVRGGRRTFKRKYMD